jgi:hypothetical protein
MTALPRDTQAINHRNATMNSSSVTSSSAPSCTQLKIEVPIHEHPFYETCLVPLPTPIRRKLTSKASTSKASTSDASTSDASAEDWTWESISRNAGITMAIVEAHPEYDWDWRAMSSNPNLSTAFVEAHLYYDWDWWAMSSTPKLSMSFVAAHLDFDWDFNEIVKHPKLNTEVLSAIHHEPSLYMSSLWWWHASNHPNITLHVSKEWGW